MTRLGVETGSPSYGASPPRQRESVLMGGTMTNQFTFTQPSREQSHHAIETICGTEKSNTSLIVPAELTPL